MTFELTYSVQVRNGEIDMDELEDCLHCFGDTDLEFVDLELIDPTEAHVTFELEADNIDECPKKLYELNDGSIVNHKTTYISKLISCTSY